MLTAANGDRSDVPNVVVVLTDGPSTYPTDTKVSRPYILYKIVTGSVKVIVENSFCIVRY